jgi:hypothetical protein
MEHLEAPLTARLPGEPDPDALGGDASGGVGEPLAGAPVSAKPKKRRLVLLAGVAAAGLVAAAGGAIVLSPYNHVIPVPNHVTAAVRQVAIEHPLALSARLTGAPERPSSIVVPPYQPKSRDQDLKEILGMRGGVTNLPSARPPAVSPAPATAVQRAALPPRADLPPAAFVPHEPGAVPAEAGPNPAPPADRQVPAGNDITPAVMAAVAGDAAPQPTPAPGQHAEPQNATLASPSPPAGPPVPAPTQPAGPVAPSPPAGAPAAALPAAPSPPTNQADAVQTALHLRAAPMSDEDQIRVLELVTQIAAMAKDLKQQNAALRADFAKTKADDQARLADFARRIDLVEAGNAVAGANGAEAPSVPPGPPAAGPATTVVRQAAAMNPVMITRVDTALGSGEAPGLTRYRVQAASPGLALLTEMARGGGDGAQIQVTVGDTIPGWGKVKSVAQRGTSWVVNTEHGVID